MTLELIIDIREKKIIDLLEKKNVSFTKEKLDCGDISIVHNKQPLIVIERKTTNDLDCSIKDGRYKEQKFRLDKLKKENIKIIYLIEGSNKSKAGWSAQINTMVRDNFHVFRVFNILETISFIETLVKNIPKFLDNLIINNLSEEYLDSITVKKKQTSPSDIYCLQLQQIPGLSATISRCIQKHYPSWSSLINNCTLQDLQNIKYKCKTGKERRIGKVVSTRLFEFLNYETEDVSPDTTADTAPDTPEDTAPDTPEDTSSHTMT